MHSPTAIPRKSIYYNYQVFKPWLPGEHGPQSRKQVVIVGSGPAGMVTALELSRQGVRSVVLESELQVSEGSRAIVFTRRSMEILQQVGVADRMLKSGLSWQFGNSFYRGQRVFRMEAPHDPDDRFPPMLNIQQQYMEQYLLEACEASPLIDFRWGNKVLSTSQENDTVTVEVDTPEGAYALQTDWLIAADGGRSGIRQSMGLKMQGSSYEGFFVIADIKVDLPLPTERLAFFDPEWNPGNTILMHREPHGIWRLDYQLPPGETPEQALEPASLKARIDAQLAMIGYPGIAWEMDWSSVYSARTLTLPQYRYGRTLFTGDAAHLLPIFGVRGANTAFQDAQSLAWHLAMVVHGKAQVRLLDNYSRERVGAAREIIDEAGKSTRFMTPQTKGFRLMRDAVLSLSLSQDFVRPLYHWRTSRPHVYADSQLNSPHDDNMLFSGGLENGAPAQNIRLGCEEFLLDHIGGCFDLLYFTQRDALPEAMVQTLAQLQEHGWPVRVTAIRRSGNAAVAGASQTLIDPEGRMHQRYGAINEGCAYLLRPDQHVCARWRQLDALRLQSTFDHLQKC
ncbi:MAG TPA: FAD-dependent monooxygenase [Comamonas sp.]|uniref:FAD-dependent monooxygenase n=1 Tax=Comamonas halotolerans TaxID=3041496 RepID=UPI0024E08CCD|nr:FAD-dependent monooxygenase [Comamonas sp. NoAH]